MTLLRLPVDLFPAVIMAAWCSSAHSNQDLGLTWISTGLVSNRTFTLIQRVERRLRMDEETIIPRMMEWLFGEAGEAEAGRF